MMTDPVADMLTQIRNAVRVEQEIVEFPASKIKAGVCQVLRDEGYIWDWKLMPKTPVPHIRVTLKYGLQGERVLRRIARVSKPSCRVYSGYKQLRPVLNGLGISVLSTSRGIMSDRQARARKLGGEVLCQVW